MTSALVVLGDRGVGQRRLQEQQRVRVLALHGRPDAAEVLHDELRQEVAQLRRLGLVPRRVVGHGLGPADVVDPDDQRLDLGVLRGRVDVQPDEPERDQRHQNQRDLQVGVQHQRGAVHLHELPLGVLERLGIEIANGCTHGPTSVA